MRRRAGLKDGDDESLNGVAIVGVAGLHLNKRIPAPVLFSSQEWMLEGRDSSVVGAM
jgi:hypothetical protein